MFCIRLYAAVPETYDPMGIGGDILLVGHYYHGIAIAVYLVEKPHDLYGCMSVQVTRRLIRQYDGGTVDQSPCKRNSLPLTAREFIGPVVHPVLQPHTPQRLCCLFPPFSSRDSGIDHRQSDILQTCF